MIALNTCFLFRSAAVDCGRPGTPVHATPSGSVYTYGHNVTLSCAQGFVLVGKASITCTYNGTWDLPLPHCAPVNCTALQAPAYGMISHTNWTYTSTVMLSCLPGFHLRGTTPVTCLANGHWDGNVASCIPLNCSLPVVPQHGYIVKANTSFQGSVYYACTSGYVGVAGSAIQMCTASGSWDSMPLECDGE